MNYFVFLILVIQQVVNNKSNNLCRSVSNYKLGIKLVVESDDII
jgi:hypothetical protein